MNANFNTLLDIEKREGTAISVLKCSGTVREILEYYIYRHPNYEGVIAVYTSVSTDLGINTRLYMEPYADGTPKNEPFPKQVLESEANAICELLDDGFGSLFVFTK